MLIRAGAKTNRPTPVRAMIAHAHAGAQPGKAFGHILPVGTHGLADQGNGCALDAVACHVAQALGAHSPGCWPQWPPCPAGTRCAPAAPAPRRGPHARRPDGTPTLPQVPQAGAGDLPGAGLADAERRRPEQQQDGQRASRPPTTVARAVPRAAPGTPSPAPQTVMPQQCPGGVDEEKVEDGIQHADQHADEAGGQGVACWHGAWRVYMPMAMVKGRAADQMAK